METFIHTMPGYRMNEYMLVLTPHEELRKKILSVKKEFAEKLDAPQALWTKPHMLLARFSQYEMMEERVVQRLKTVAMSFHPVKIELKDFAAYPSHSVIIQITSRETLKELIKDIRESQKLLRPDMDHKPYFTEDPHIIIASKLKPWQFEKGWLEFSHRHFTGRFIASDMLLLKRRSGEKAWQILDRLAFQNLPVAVRQGELFG